MISNGIEIGTSALKAHQYAMDVIGNNIANVNTPGYSRQRVNLDTGSTTLISILSANKPLASLGSGVKLSGIERIRDDFFDSQRRDNNKDLGTWNQLSTNYGIVEGVFNEPSDTGISANLNNFWNAWQAVASPDPSSSGARSSLVSQGQILCNSMSLASQQLTDLQENNDKDIEAKVSQINEIADQIAALNGSIVKAKASGDANDLLDSRTELLSQLAGLVNIECYEDPLGASTIAIGGVFIVAGGDVTHLSTVSNSMNNGYKDVVWEDNNKQAVITDGELFGLIQTRDVNVPQFMNTLNTMAQTMMAQVNTIHRSGYGLNGTTGLSFFVGTGAGDMSINSELVNDLSKVAGSSSSINAEGNGENAAAIAKLRSTGVLNSASTTINDYYFNMISALGTATSEAATYVKTNQALLTQTEKQIDSVSGVSIDEEMTEMIKFEHAYGAAAKYISAVQRTLDDLMAIIR